MRKPDLRRVARLAGRGAGALVALIVVATLGLHTGPGRAWVKHRIEGAADGAMTGHVTIGELDYRLFGACAVRDVVLKDADGAEIMTASALEIAPVWSSLAWGSGPRASRVAVRGVKLHVVVDKDGVTNLAKLKKPKRPPVKKPPKPPKAPLVVAIEQLAIDDVTVVVDRAVGGHGKIGITHLEGSFSTGPQARDLDLDVGKLALEIAVDAGEGSGVAVKKLETKGGVHVRGGALDLSVGPTRADVEVALPGSPPRGMPLALAPVHAHVGAGGDVTGDLGAVEIGALALRAVELRGGEGAAKGERHATLAGVTVDAEKLNGFAGKKLLTRNVTVDASVDQAAAEKFGVALTIAAGDDKIDLRGDVTPGQGAAPPVVSLHATAKDLDTTRFLGVDLGAPPVTLGALDVEVSGAVGEIASLAAKGKVSVTSLVSGAAHVDQLDAEAHVEKGEVVVDSLAIQALGAKVDGSATFVIADKHLHVELSPSGAGAEVIEPLRTLGVASPAVVRTLALAPDAVHLTFDGVARGPIHATVRADKVGVAGGTVGLDGEADLVLNEPGAAQPMRVEKGHVTVEIAGVDAGVLAGKRLPVAASVRGRIELEATPPEAGETMPVVGAKYDLAARVRPAGDARAAASVVAVHGEATKSRAKLRATVSSEAERGKHLVAVDLEAALDANGISLDKPISAKIEVAHADLRDLARLAGAEAPRGHLDLKAKVVGTARRPSATFEAALDAMAIGSETQRFKAHGTVKPSPKGAGRVVVEADVDGWLRSATFSEAAPLVAHAVVDEAPFGAASSLTWSMKLDLAPQPIASLGVPVSALGVQGRAEVHAKLDGTRDDAIGDVQVALADLGRDAKGPLAAAIAVALGADAARVTVDVRAQGSTLLSAKGKVGVAGKGLFTALRDKKRENDPALDLDIVVPEGRAGSLGALVPALAGSTARFSGKGGLRGKASAPALDLKVDVDAFKALGGGDGRAVFALHGDKKGATFRLGLGPDGGLVAEGALPIAGGGGAFGIPELKVKIRADGADVRSVPAFFAGGTHDLTGRLSADVDGAFSMRPSIRGLSLKAELSGEASLAGGRLGVAGSRRVIDGIAAELRFDASEIQLAKLVAREGPRSLEARGTIAVDDLTPGHVDFRLTAHDWLVWGGSLGTADAPQAALTADVRVKGDVEGPKKNLDVELAALGLRPADKGEAIRMRDVLARRGDRDPRRAAAVASEKGITDEAHGWDVHVHIPKPIRLQQEPMRLDAQGNVDVFVRPGGQRIRGKLDVVRGRRLTSDDAWLKGTIVFDADHPAGEFDLHL